MVCLATRKVTRSALRAILANWNCHAHWIEAHAHLISQNCQKHGTCFSRMEGTPTGAAGSSRSYLKLPVLETWDLWLAMRRERTGAKHAVKVGGAAGEDGAVAVEAPARRRSLPERPRRLGYQHHVRVLGVVEQRGQVRQVALIMHDDLSTCRKHVKGRRLSR